MGSCQLCPLDKAALYIMYHYLKWMNNVLLHIQICEIAV
jgi:hypothetical protein